MFDQSNNDPFDDEFSDDFSNQDGTAENAAMVLVRTAFEMALSKKMRVQLKRHPNITIVHVPDRAWIAPMAQMFKLEPNAPILRPVTERAKSGGILHRMGEKDLRWLQEGQSVMFITHDPSELLHEAVLACADLSVAIPPLTPKTLAKVIARLTGGRPRGLSVAMAKLDLAIIVSLLRPGMTARQCVGRLRDVAERGRTRVLRFTPTAPKLDALPLPATVRAWSDQALANIRAVDDGVIAPQKLVYVTLEGPPGNGKTLIAESLASSAGWSFVSSSVGAWFTTGDGALGGVSQNLKSFIDTVLDNEPCIGLLDEIDAFPDRATMDNRSRDWWTLIITLLLTEIDRLKKSGRRVMLIGATNYYERLDAALIRPGRLQQRVSVQPPQSEAEVVALLRYFVGEELPRAELAKLGRLGVGATPASVEAWINQARNSARSEDRALEVSDLVAQMVPLDERSAADIRAVAIHEIGHAVVACRLGHEVKSVSIIAQGASGGRTLTTRATEAPTWRHVTDMVALALGGRAADIVVGMGANTGAEADLAQATSHLLAAHETQGLRGGLVSRHVINSVERSNTTLKFIERELGRQLSRAVAIITADQQAVLALVDRLVTDKILAGSEIAAALIAVPARVRPGDHGTAALVDGMAGRTFIAGDTGGASS